jgi:hypothetical protein
VALLVRWGRVDVLAAETHDLVWAAIATGFAGIVITLIQGRGARREARGARTEARGARQATARNKDELAYLARKLAKELKDEMRTENDHTIGSGISRLEDQMFGLHHRLDRVEVGQEELRQDVQEIGHSVADNALLLSDHLNEVQPLADWTRQQMETDEP